MKRFFIGLLLLLGVVGGLAWWKDREVESFAVTLPPIVEVTPEVIEAINKKISIITVEVPLSQVDVKPPDVTITILLGTFSHVIESGEFWSGGKLFVGFQKSRITAGDQRIELTLGKPVPRGLDDTFVTVSHTTSSWWNGDVHFVDKARHQGRVQLLKNACHDGTYEKTNVAAATLMKQFIKSIAPQATVVVHTTPATC